MKNKLTLSQKLVILMIIINMLLKTDFLVFQIAVHFILY